MKNLNDDNRTIADMNVEGMPWYSGKKTNKNNSKTNIERIDLTKEERKAMFIGLIQAMIPITVIIALVFIFSFVFLDIVWLR